MVSQSCARTGNDAPEAQGLFFDSGTTLQCSLVPNAHANSVLTGKANAVHADHLNEVSSDMRRRRFGCSDRRPPTVLYVFATARDAAAQKAKEPQSVHVLGGLLDLTTDTVSRRLNFDLPRAQSYDLSGLFPRTRSETTLEVTATVMFLAETVLLNEHVIGYPRDLEWPIEPTSGQTQ